MEETTNYGLKLIEDTDDYTDIFDDHNDSMEIIDTELAKKLESVPVMTGAASSAAGSAGLVPAPSAGDQDKVLTGGGTWETIPTMTGATSTAAGTAGTVPAPTAGASNRFLSCDGTWKVPAGGGGGGGSQAGIYTVYATIPDSSWLGSGPYSVTLNDQTIIDTMQVLEWGITNETEANPLMLGETNITVGNGTLTIETTVLPEATWNVQVDLGADGSDVLEEVGGKADQEILGYKETGATATHAIQEGQFVVWNGDLCTAKVTIAIGDTLGSSNLEAVTGGGLNKLAERIGNTDSTVSTLNTRVSGLAGGAVNQVLCKNTAADYDTKWAYLFARVAVAVSVTSSDVVMKGFNVNVPTGYEPISVTFVPDSTTSYSGGGYTFDLRYWGSWNSDQYRWWSLEFERIGSSTTAFSGTAYVYCIKTSA